MALVGSPLISIRTLPVLTSLARAARISTTKIMTMMVNITTPPTIAPTSIICRTRKLQRQTAEGHEAQRHETGCDECNAQTAQPLWHIAVLELLAYPRQRGYRQRPANPRAGAVDDTLREGVAAFHHEQRGTHDGAVHRDQRQEDAQRVVERRHVFIQHHLENLHHGSDDTDVADEAEKAQIHVRKAGPGQAAVA